MTDTIADGLKPCPFQERVADWMEACFTPEIIADKLERADRFIEEALELVQATGYCRDRALALVDYAFGRPAGEPFQEVGGVRVTLAALCNTHGLDETAAAEAELARIWTKIDKIRAKQATKPVGSALPVLTPNASVPAELVERLKIAFAASLMNANAGLRWLDHDSMDEMIESAWVGFEQVATDIAAMPPAGRVEELEALVALADAADKCAEAPHFIVQPFLGVYRKHGETIARARAALSGERR